MLGLEASTLAVHLRPGAPQDALKARPRRPLEEGVTTVERAASDFSAARPRFGGGVDGRPSSVRTELRIGRTPSVSCFGGRPSRPGFGADGRGVRERIAAAASVICCAEY